MPLGGSNIVFRLEPGVAKGCFVRVNRRNSSEIFSLNPALNLKTIFIGRIILPA